MKRLFSHSVSTRQDKNSQWLRWQDHERNSFINLIYTLFILLWCVRNCASREAFRLSVTLHQVVLVVVYASQTTKHRPYQMTYLQTSLLCLSVTSNLSRSLSLRRRNDSLITEQTQTNTVCFLLSVDAAVFLSWPPACRVSVYFSVRHINSSSLLTLWSNHNTSSMTLIITTAHCPHLCLLCMTSLEIPFSVEHSSAVQHAYSEQHQQPLWLETKHWKKVCDSFWKLFMFVVCFSLLWFNFTWTNLPSGSNTEGWVVVHIK